MELSVPLQFTSSIQILPVPVKRGKHNVLAATRKQKGGEKGLCVCVNDMAMPWRSLQVLFTSGGSHLPSLFYRECILRYELSFL